MRPFKINFLNSLVFILCGVAGFVSHYAVYSSYNQQTLIPVVLGMLLLVMTPYMRTGSRVISRIVTLLTLIFGIIVLLMLFTCMGSDKVTARRMIILTIIALSSFASLGLYLSTWVAERRKE
jgi:hypothetical protein